jgi:predicted nucleotide-binding protein
MICFISISSKRKREIEKLKCLLKKFGFKPILAAEIPSVGRLIFCKICKLIQICDFAIVELTGWNANVLMELGLIHGLEKDVIILLKKGERPPSNIQGLEYILYDTLKDLEDKLSKYFSSLSKEYVAKLEREVSP